MNNNTSSTTLCQPSCGLSCGYYFSSGLVISDTVFSSTSHSPLYNAASRVFIDGGRKVLQTAALGGMLAQNLAVPAEALWVSSGTRYVGTGTLSGASVGGYYSYYATLDVWGVGKTVSTIISRNGTELVSSGASATGTRIYSGGQQQVYYFGSAINATVYSGGTQLVFYGGVASGTIVSSGGDQQTGVVGSSGGTLVSTVINNGGDQTILSGGIARYTSVNSGGTQWIFSGGTASSTILSNGGDQLIGQANGSFGAGSAIYTSINSGADQWIFRNGVAVSTVINNGGEQHIGQPNGSGGAGIARYTSINSGGVQWINSGGIAVSTTINNEGEQYIESNGIASNTTVVGNGQVILSNGGKLIVSGVSTSNISQIAGGNIQAIVKGGDTSTYVSGTNPNGAFSLINGVASNFIVYDGGNQTVSSGGIARGTTLMNGGGQNVYNSGTVSGTIVSSGGNLTVMEGGIASDITQKYNANVNVYVNSNVSTYVSGTYENGSHFLLSNKIASGFILNNGGAQYVQNGGTASNTIINSAGNQYVYSSGSAVAITINAGGTQYVSGGSAINTSVNGSQVVYTGGRTTGTVVSTGGNQTVSTGGIAQNTIISSGGRQNIFYNGTASSATISNSGTQIINSGGTARQTTISTGGSQVISSGGVALGTTISTGGVQSIAYRGIASSTVIKTGGSQNVASGGSALNYTIEAGGVQNLAAGAVALGANILGTQNISGIISSAIVFDGGALNVISGGWAGYTTVSSGGIQTISAGGSGYGTVVSAGGLEKVYGKASSARLNYLGVQQVHSGGSASGTTVVGGGQIVELGGTADNTVVSAVISTISGVASVFGAQHVYGQANSARLNLNATQMVYADGIASNTTIVGGGQIVDVGGTAENTVISGIISTVSGSSLNFGAQHVYGQANSTRLNLNATQMVYSGGSALNTTIVGGGQIVDVGGTAENTVISGIISTVSGSSLNFGVQHVYGQANSTRLNLNAIQNVYSGGSALNTTIVGGGQIVDVGGTAENTVISGIISTVSGSSLNFGVQRIYGQANSTVISPNAEQHIFSDGIVSKTTLQGGYQFISSGGIANDTVINTVSVYNSALRKFEYDYGAQYLFNSAVANGVTINRDAEQHISGGSASDTVISGGFQFVSEGGVASNTIVNAVVSDGGTYGAQRIYAGGNAVSTIVNSGAAQYVSSGGTASSVVINYGGIHKVYSGGSINGITVNSGGSSYIYVNSGEVNIGNVANNGKIQLEGPYYSNVTSITQLSGDGGKFLMDFSLRYQAADKIVITSAHSGNHTIILNDWKDNGNASMAISGDGLKVVEYSDTVDDSDITGTFSGSYDRGAYVYTLQKGTLSGEGNDYYLRSNGEYTGIYKSMLTVPLMNFAALKVSMASLNNHITSLRDMNNVETTNGIWYRGNYSNLTLSKFGDIDIKYQGMDAGWEWKMFRKTDDLEKGPRGFYMGVTASHTGLSMQDKKKEKSGSFADGGSLIAGGVYGTYVSDSGFFWDFSGKYGQNSIEMTHQTADDDLLSYNPKRNVMIGGAELGWAFSLGQNKTGLTFIPKAGYQFMSADKAEIEVKDYRANKIGMAAFGGAKYSAMAGTLAISYIPKDKSGFYIEPFAEATYSSLSGDEEVTYAGVTEKSEIDKSMLEVYAGFDMTFSRNFSLHLAGSMMKSESIKSVGGDLGLTFKFGGKNAETF